MGKQLVRHRPAFLAAHALQVVERLLQHLLDDRPIVVQLVGVSPRFGDDAGQRQHLAHECLGTRHQVELGRRTAQLLDVTVEGDGVDAEVGGRALAVAAQVDLQGAALDTLANDLFELSLQQLIGIGGAQRHFQVAIVEGSQLDRQRELIALVARLPVASHTQKHANLAGVGSVNGS